MTAYTYGRKQEDEMGLVLVDGFDHYAQPQAAEKFWAGGPFHMGPGRGFGGQSAEVIRLNPMHKDFPSTYGTVICAAAYQMSGSPSSVIMTLETVGGVVVASLGLNGTGHLTLTDGAASLIATGTTVVPYNTWFQVAVKIIVGTSGHGTVQLNGGAEIASTLGNFGTTNIGRVAFWQNGLGQTTFVDDVVILDGSGSAPLNDFLGDVRVETLYPLADGTHTDWTPKTGTDHHAMVDEALIDGDGSYVYDATPGDKDSYILETFIGSIYGAQLNVGARKGDASVRQIAPLVRQAGTDHAGTTYTLSSDYVFYSWLLDNDPTGSPWLAATINADEFGQSLIS